jgi:hypothetical protein
VAAKGIIGGRYDEAVSRLSSQFGILASVAGTRILSTPFRVHSCSVQLHSPATSHHEPTWHLYFTELSRNEASSLCAPNPDGATCEQMSAAFFYTQLVVSHYQKIIYGESRSCCYATAGDLCVVLYGYYTLSGCVSSWCPTGHSNIVFEHGSTLLILRATCMKMTHHDDSQPLTFCPIPELSMRVILVLPDPVPIGL